MLGKDITTARAGAVEQVPAGLEEKLVWLCKFGAPRIHRCDRGWCACIEMHVSSVGAKFDIRSEFNHKSPSVAMDVLIERILEALATINGRG